MVLRLETHLFRQNIRTLLPGFLAPFPISGWSIDRIHIFSQEQRVKDISLDRDPGHGTRWIWAVRPREPGPSVQTLELLEAAGETIAHGKRTVRDAAPLSFLPGVPIVKPDPDNKTRPKLPWHITGTLHDKLPWQRSLDEPPPGGGDTAPEWRAIDKFDLDIRSMEPRAIDDMWLGANNPAILHEEITGTLPRLVSATGEASGPLMFNAGEISAPAMYGTRSINPEAVAGAPAFQPALSQEDQMRPVSPVVRFAIDLRGITHRVPNVGREVEIGAFRMRLTQDVAADDRPRETLVEIRKTPASNLPNVLPFAIDAALMLRVDDVDPAGQDPVHGSGQHHDDPAAPLLFRLPRDKGPDPAAEETASYLLRVWETVDRGADHEVGLALHAVRQRPATERLDSVLVLDPRPFRATSVHYRDLAASRSDETNEVAVWNPGGENGLSWRIRDVEQSVRLVAPPSVIGEAMEKNAVTDGDRPPDIDPDRPAAARIGPLTNMEIDPTFFETNYREPGWNLRRILGYPGQRSPGSRLKSLHLEMAYGMMAGLQPQSDVWIAELDGVFGAPVAAIDDINTSGNADVAAHLQQARSILEAERNRLAVDRLWSGHPDARLKLTDGVSFRLRRKEDKTNGPATPFRWPVPGDRVAPEGLPQKDREAIEATFSHEPDDRRSFPGGIPWAFESANILLEVYGNPDSVGGRIEDVHLSALGAWGGQRGLFALGKTIIETETTQGRMQRYKLERIGRIGGLWHRAKHVIIYERTVVPPRQFYNEPPIGKQQDEHAGRPILRKVEEFVEILQPVRRYPENGTSTAEAAFLLGVEFKSRIIRVDSRWGGDVRREGWRVPLWNTVFSQEGNQAAPAQDDEQAVDQLNPDDPSLTYPKPQIHCLFAGEDGAEISVEIDQPEKLHFFTSTISEEGDDTDSWRSVRGVDFIDLPAPRAGQVARRSEALTDAMLPPEPADAAGWEALTIGLVQDRQAVAITHGRSDGPAAPLRNFTISRSTRARSAQAARLEQVSDVSANLRAELDTAVGQALGALEKLDPALNAETVGPVARAKAKSEFSRALNSSMARLSANKKNVLNFDALGSTITLPPTADGNVKDRIEAEVRAAVQRIAEGARVQVNDAAAQMTRPIEGTVAAALALQSLLNAPAFDGSGWPDQLDPDDLAALVGNARSAMFAFVLDAVEDLAAHFDENIEIDFGGFARYFPVDGSKARILATKLAEVKTALDALHNAVGTSGESTAAGNLKDKIDAITDAEVEAIASGASGGGSVNRAILFAFTTVRDHLGDLAHRIEQRLPGVPETIELKKQLKRQQQVVDHLAQAMGKVAQAVDLIDPENTGADNLVQAFGLLAGTLHARLTTVLDTIFGHMLSDALLDRMLDVEEAIWKDDAGEIGDWKRAVLDALAALLGEARQAQQAVIQNVESGRAEALRAVEDIVEKVMADADAAAVKLAEALSAFEDFVRQLLAAAENFAALVGDVLGLSDAALLVQRIEDAVNDAIDGIDDNAARRLEQIKAAAHAEAARAVRLAESRARQLMAAAQETVTEAIGVDPVSLLDDGTRLAQNGSETLRLIRAVGDPPKTDRLGLNRPEVAYVLDAANRFVDITPAVSLVNRVSDTIAAAEKAGQAVGSLLEPFGVRLPTGKLAEQILPDELTNLSVAALLPDMGGLDLQALLKNVGFPELSDSDAIKVTRGFDKATKRAWMEAKIDVPFTESLDVLDFGPVKIVVDDARFTSFARISGGLEGIEKKVQGRIAGDWRVVSVGQDILTFQRTGLFFDDTGKIDFKISPERVVLAEPLEFLTNFLAAAGQGEGLTVEPLMQGGIPAGVAATLDLALPNLTAGVFSITDLSLHAMFGIAAIPEFELISELSVAKRTAPFTLSVWILNGGGYVTQRLSYRPLAKPKPVLTYTLDVGIVAGVGLFFNFGVVSGGVSLQVGCSIAVTWTTVSGGNTTTITVFILARGNVDVAGIVTANITLLLEVSYDGSVMLGRGTLRLSFKISCFYTLRVNQGVEYKFAGKKRKPTNYAENFE